MITNDTNKYSIVLPVRNGGEHVKECLRSLFSQTFPGFNIVVLDNNSTDGTFEWLQSLHNEKIIVHRSVRDLTIEENWARIVSVQKNEFVTLIGHDDILFPNYLQAIDRLISDYPQAGLYLTHFDYIDEKSQLIRECRPMAATVTAAEFIKKQMTDQYDSTGSGYMMRSKDFNLLGGMPTEYPNLIFADFQLWINLMLPSFLAISPQKYFAFRIHSSTAQKTNGMAYQQAFSLYIDYLTFLAGRYTDIREVVTRYGKAFLLYYCEALSHRLLKTPIGQRTLMVTDFVAKCKSLAIRFIPGQKFEPKKKFKIWLAIMIDKTGLSRRLFQAIKKAR